MNLQDRAAWVWNDLDEVARDRVSIAEIVAALRVLYSIYECVQVGRGWSRGDRIGRHMKITKAIRPLIVGSAVRPTARSIANLADHLSDADMAVLRSEVAGRTVPIDPPDEPPPAAPKPSIFRI